MTSGNWNSSGMRILVILCIACILMSAKAQEISKLDLEERAEQLFEQQRYGKAMADYEVLYNMYPKDAQYAYYLGRCYLHSNHNPEKASELLKFAATRNYGDDTYFYLGQAYHLNYSFEDATLSFLTFKKKAPNRLLRKLDVEYYLQQTANAKQAVELAQKVEVKNLLIVPQNAVGKAFADNIDGRYIPVPEEFLSETDLQTGYRSMMYYPAETKVGDYVFFSSQSKKGRHGSDIYRAQRVSEKAYSLPEVLPEQINTAYDEAYPYFDKLSSTLYFSSRGHNTSGGYDIFKTRYDPIAKNWSTPEKLAFPVNSVDDDFMYTPTKATNEVIFFTSRNIGKSEYKAYTVELFNQGEYVSPADREEVVTLALLNPSSGTTDEEMMMAYEPVSAVTEELTIEEEDPEQEAHSVLIEEALDFQAASDSMDAEADKLRMEVPNINDYQKKQEMVASIATLDKEAQRLRQMADKKFREAELLRNPETSPADTDIPDNLTAQNTSSGITLYTYNTPAPITADPEPEDKGTYTKGYEAADKMSQELASSFNILQTSPYSSNNPIPVASIPEGLVYRIQLGAYTKNIPQNTFRGLTPVSKQQVSGATKYYVGIFGSISDARKALDEVKAYGYPDAFLVSFYNYSKISVQEAREIEFSDR